MKSKKNVTPKEMVLALTHPNPNTGTFRIVFTAPIPLCVLGPL